MQKIRRKMIVSKGRPFNLKGGGGYFFLFFKIFCLGHGQKTYSESTFSLKKSVIVEKKMSRQLMGKKKIPLRCESKLFCC